MFIGVFLLFVSCIIWSSTPIFAKIAYSSLTPEVLANLRLIFAALLFFMIRKPVFTKDIILLSIFGLSANYFFYHVGILYTTTPAAQSIESLAPIFVLIFAILMKAEKVNMYKVLAVLLSFFGSILIFISHIGKEFLIGDILEIFAAITWGYFIVKSSKVLREHDIFTVLSSVFFISSFVLLPFSVASSFINFHTSNFHIYPSFSSLYIVVIMGFLHTFLAYLIYYAGIRRTSPIISGIVFSFSPVLTLLFSEIFLDEYSTTTFIGGVLLISVALFIAVFGYKNKTQK